jgi:hypothetical protein
MADLSTVGSLAADIMDAVEEEYGENSSASVGIVAVVAEVNVDEEDGPGFTHVLYRCSDNRRWVQAGLFDAAKLAVNLGHAVSDGD